MPFGTFKFQGGLKKRERNLRVDTGASNADVADAPSEPVEVDRELNTLMGTTIRSTLPVQDNQTSLLATASKGGSRDGSDNISIKYAALK